MNLREAAQQALEALETKGEHHPRVYRAIEALRAALAQPEQEPVAWMLTDLDGKPMMECEDEPFVKMHPSLVGPDTDWRPLYTHPPRREWRSLTEEEIVKFADEVSGEEHSVEDFARAIEAALKEKNK